MIILDWIRNILMNNKLNTTIYTKSIVKKFGENDQFEVALFDADNPLPDKELIININGRDYTRVTDDSGVARLNINLMPGVYPVLVTFNGDELYNRNTAHASVTVKADTRMEGTNINMTYKDGTKYQCAVYDPNNNRVKDTVKLTINGVTYTRSPDNEGLYKLNINLNPGTYDLKAVFEGNSVYNGSSILNNIVINPAPTPEPKKECTNPYESKPHPTNAGCNGMGQNNSVCCGPSSIHKAIYKFGIRDITQNQIASWAGTTSAGSSHQGLETAIAKINQVKGTNISIKWYNLSDLGWEGLGKLICQDNIAAFTHILYKNGGTCSGSGNFGHYESITKINLATGYVKVINSLGDYCGSCYCGYYQDRTIACEEVFISGISQKSIAVLKMN